MTSRHRGRLHAAELPVENGFAIRPILCLSIEEENGKLKRIVADLSLDKAMLQDVIRRKL